MPSRPEILQLLVDILTEEMNLKSDQVVIYNQRWITPNDQRLYLSLHVIGSKPYANNRGYRSRGTFDPSTGIVTQFLDEKLSVNVADMISLHVMSYGDQARLRRNEPLFALHSTYAEQQMERWGFHVGPVPSSFSDASEAIGTDFLTRYAITFNVIYAQGVTKPVEYYSSIPIGEPVIQP